jgi:hypothetical protein
MAIISILVRPSVNCRSAFVAVTFLWQDPVPSWKAGPVEVMTLEKQQQQNKKFATVL